MGNYHDDTMEILALQKSGLPANRLRKPEFVRLVEMAEMLDQVAARK